MAERPIIFSSPMVRAILDGRKTQTRRVLKDRHGLLARYEPTGEVVDYYGTGKTCGARLKDTTFVIPCGYVPGDLLWVRETWANSTNNRGPIYRADGESLIRWKSPIHMPRRLSRIKLRVTDVRVQRLQDVSEKDAEAEGVFRHIAEHSINKVFRSERGPMAIRYFRETWDTINAKRGYPWENNPWVAAISFERADNG